MTRSVLCVGIDPEADGPARRLPRDARGRRALRAARARGVAAGRHRDQAEPRVLRGVRRRRGSRPSSGSGPWCPPTSPFVADAKRGDIGTTAARQAAALFDVLGADAVTVNPYLGEEAVAPLLERGDRFAYVLCRTSNPGAAELQGLEVAADDAAGAPVEPLYARVARRATGWGPGGTVGLVVGATAPAELAAIRAHRAGPRVPRPGRRRAGRGGRAGARRRPRDRGAGGRPSRRRPARQRLARDRPRGPGRATDRTVPATPGSVSPRPPVDWADRLAVLP